MNGRVGDRDVSSGPHTSFSPAFDVASIAVCATLPSTTAASSLDHGWRSMLVEHRVMPSGSREFSIGPTTDTHIILRLNGSHRIETRRATGWRGGVCEIGSLHLIGEGETEHVRYTTSVRCEFGHFFIPSQVMGEAAELLRSSGERERSEVPRLSGLHVRDPLTAGTCRALLTGSANHYPDMYAEQAALWLAVHALVHRRALEPGLPSAAISSRDFRLRRSIDLIRDAFDQPLTLDRLAQEAGITKFHFTRLFRRHTGFTPVAYLEQVRLAAARRHLRHGDCSITEVASRTGFRGPDQFSAAFKRVCGVSPSAYRAARGSWSGHNLRDERLGRFD